MTEEEIHDIIGKDVWGHKHLVLVGKEVSFEIDGIKFEGNKTTYIISGGPDGKISYNYPPGDTLLFAASYDDIKFEMTYGWYKLDYYYFYYTIGYYDNQYYHIPGSKPYP